MKAALHYARSIAAWLLLALSSLSVLAQVGALRAAVVRIVPGDPLVPGDARKSPGTGFIVMLDGRAAYILTASHVIEGAKAPKVEFFTQRNSLLAARVAEGAELGDDRGLALLIVDAPLPAGLSALPIDATAKLEGGEAIEVIGHPNSGGSWGISRGDINSRKGRVLFVSAPIDGGNSGGPVLREGKVVGIVTQKKATFGEALGSLTIADFLRGNDIDVATVGQPAVPPTVVPRPQIKSSAPTAAPDNVISAMRPGEVFRDCDDCPEMVVVPAGSFLMGSPETEDGRQKNEGPQHKVDIKHRFAISKTEVTRAQFARFVDATDHKSDGGCIVWNDEKTKPELRTNLSWQNPGFSQTDHHPVVCVSWHDANAYVRWLAKRARKNYQLPSEAQWEYAARAGWQSARHWSDKYDPEGCEYANIADATAKKILAFKNWQYSQCDDGQAYTAPVRFYQPNAFGLYDMIGNAWEWTQDCSNESYSDAPTSGDAQGKGDCGRRVLRGGSWLNDPDYARAANRIKFSSDEHHGHVGFRLARTD